MNTSSDIRRFARKATRRLEKEIGLSRRSALGANNGEQQRFYEGRIEGLRLAVAVVRSAGERWEP